VRTTAATDVVDAGATDVAIAAAAAATAPRGH